jgi:hypothetical protein
MHTENVHVFISCEHRQQNARPSTIKLHADSNLTSKLIEECLSNLNYNTNVSVNHGKTNPDSSFLTSTSV